MLTLGNGPKEVMAFVDPYCKHCHNLIGQIDDALKAAYTFKLVLVPVGKESAVTIKKLMCNKDRAASLKAFIDQDFSKYTPVAGIGELRRAVCDRYRSDYGVEFQDAEVILSAGGKQALFNTALSLFSAGDEVITHAPYWPTLSE
jgi:aspartate/methionine/tyrosine aminotransferase